MSGGVLVGRSAGRCPCLRSWLTNNIALALVAARMFGWICLPDFGGLLLYLAEISQY